MKRKSKADLELDLSWARKVISDQAIYIVQLEALLIRYRASHDAWVRAEMENLALSCECAICQRTAQFSAFTAPPADKRR